MSIHNHHTEHPRGRLTHIEVHSECLANNPLGDPVRRRVTLYLPADYDHLRRVPVIYYLAAYTNSGLAAGDWRAFSESLPERLDRLIGEGRLQPVVVVFPDCFTRLGGNQYLDSAGVGQYASHIHQEIVPAIEAQFKVADAAAGRAVMGKSSGGFAALRFAMDWPGHWGVVANQSGDAGFDITYARDFPLVADTLAEFNGDVERFIRRFWRAKKINGAQIMTLMHLCLAATYDPTEDGRIQLPFDLHTGRLDPVRWRRWLAHDPVQRVADHAEALKRLNGLFMDCGQRDQFYMHYGMRQLSAALENHGIEHTYEEFNGTHSGIDYRLDVSLPYISERLTC